MVNEELEKKFEKPEFKELLKDHRNSTIWDVVLFAISLLCLIIISFTPCIEISGEKFYKNFMDAYRTEIINYNDNALNDNENKKLVEGRDNAIALVIEKICNQDDPKSVELAAELKYATYLRLLPLDPIMSQIKNKKEYDNEIAKRAERYSELKLSCSMVDFGKIVLNETFLKSDTVGVFAVAGFGVFFDSFVPLSFFVAFLMEAIMFVISIVKLCVNKKFTQYMYNKRYTENNQKRTKIQSGMQSISVLFYMLFTIFYFCSSSKTKFFKDPARIFFGALKVSPLIYVMLGISAIVFIMSLINVFRKKNIHYWMCTHA